jgi:hypothetical protein
MAIKDLRKMTENINVDEIKKEAFIEAYETILKENVVLTESELEKIIKETKKKAIKEFKEGLKVDVDLFESEEIIAIPESKIEEAEEKFLEKIDEKLKSVIGDDNYAIMKECIKNGESFYVVTDEIIDESEEQLTSELVEEFDEQIEEAIGEENFEIISKAIKEGKEFFIIDEDTIPMVEQKMIEKIKESEYIQPSEYVNKEFKENDVTDTTGSVSLAEKLITRGTVDIKETEESEKSLAERLI